MPFELGLDVGCRYYAASRYRSKRCLILERDRSLEIVEYIGFVREWKTKHPGAN